MRGRQTREKILPHPSRTFDRVSLKCNTLGRRQIKCNWEEHPLRKRDKQQIQCKLFAREEKYHGSQGLNVTTKAPQLFLVGNNVVT